jgi:hypothetical protein
MDRNREHPMRKCSFARALTASLVAVSLGGCSSQRFKSVYVETFDRGPGGWYADRHYALPVWDGVAYCHSPWWVDANHAPPGAGYLHIVMWLYTTKNHYQADTPYTRALPYRGNPFAERGYSTNLTNARLTVRLRGEADLKGAHLLLLVQAKTDKTTANFVLSGQPFQVTRDWSGQTVVLRLDPNQWTCLGARNDMRDVYGCDDIARVLRDVNLDIIFVLFPLKVTPSCGQVQDVHKARAGKDYPVNQQELPAGLIMFDSVRIEYPL